MTSPEDQSITSLLAKEGFLNQEVLLTALKDCHPLQAITLACHHRNVCQLSLTLNQHPSITSHSVQSETLITALKQAALHHDLGKVKIPHEVWNPQRILTPRQVDRFFGDHAVQSVNFLTPEAIEQLPQTAYLILFHHRSAQDHLDKLNHNLQLIPGLNQDIPSEPLQNSLMIHITADCLAARHENRDGRPRPPLTSEYLIEKFAHLPLSSRLQDSFAHSLNIADLKPYAHQICQHNQASFFPSLNSNH